MIKITVLCLILFVSTNGRCESAAEALDASMAAAMSKFQAMAKSSDHAGLLHSIEDAEKRWVSDANKMYFITMHQLFEAICTESKFTESDYSLLQKIVSLIATKDVEAPSVNYSKFIECSNILKLMRGDKFTQYFKALPPASREVSRAKEARFVALLIRQAKTRIKPNFEILPTSKNVSPPDVGNGKMGPVEAGMRPSAIKDPETRAAYIHALNMNSLNGAINSEQGCLSRFLKDEMPSIEGFLTERYSMEPLAYEELNEYMVLGNFGEESRRSVFDCIVAKTRVQPPFGLVPTTEEIERKKSKEAAEKIESQKYATPKVDGEKKP